ncbi:hypothetical protein VPH35_012601 [Triticum aestivum]|uniref:uncharacterized protein n=1 Tax=Triticum aestivum TaxID=4565 RepID=UPI000989F226|nr:uncharacterized protein LOC123163472 [Triticum aestivum]
MEMAGLSPRKTPDNVVAAFSADDGRERVPGPCRWGGREPLAARSHDGRSGVEADGVHHARERCGHGHASRSRRRLLSAGAIHARVFEDWPRPADLRQMQDEGGGVCRGASLLLFETSPASVFHRSVSPHEADTRSVESVLITC